MASTSERPAVRARTPLLGVLIGCLSCLVLAIVVAPWIVPDALRIPDAGGSGEVAEVTTLRAQDRPGPATIRSPIDDLAQIKIEIRDSEGDPLSGWIGNDQIRVDAPGGRAFVPVDSGRVRVAAADHAPRWVVAETRDLVVVLSRGYSVSGVLVDAVSGAPVQTEIELVNVDGPQRETVAAAGDGFFAFYGLDPGRYRLSATRKGYLDLCASVDAGEPDVEIVVDANKSVRLPMFPLYGGYVIVENTSGMPGGVFRSMISVISTSPSTAYLPSWAHGHRRAFLRAAQKERGEDGWVAMLRVLSGADQSKDVRFTLRANGRRVGTYSITLAPVDRPTRLRLPVQQDWRTHLLSVSSEVPFAVSLHGSVLSAIPFAAGSHVLTLPEGVHRITVNHSALMQGFEGQTIRLFEDASVDFAIDIECGTLTVRAPDAWGAADGCFIDGPGGSIFVPRDRDFPYSHLVRAGSYRVSVVRQRATGGNDRLWTVEREVGAGQSVEVNLGQR